MPFRGLFHFMSCFHWRQERSLFFQMSEKMVVCLFSYSSQRQFGGGIPFHGRKGH